MSGHVWLPEAPGGVGSWLWVPPGRGEAGAQARDRGPGCHAGGWWPEGSLSAGPTEEDTCSHLASVNPSVGNLSS